MSKRNITFSCVWVQYTAPYYSLYEISYYDNGKTMTSQRIFRDRFSRKEVASFVKRELDFILGES